MLLENSIIFNFINIISNNIIIIMNEYLKSFVIGSSWFSFVIFFWAVYSYQQQNVINYKYDDYTFKAPLTLGLIAMVAKYIYLNTDLSLWKSLLLTSLCSSILTMIGITIFKAYSFKSQKRWFLQYLTILVGHTFTFTIVVYNIEKLL